MDNNNTPIANNEGKKHYHKYNRHRRKPFPKPSESGNTDGNAPVSGNSNSAQTSAPAFDNAAVKPARNDIPQKTEGDSAPEQRQSHNHHHNHHRPHKKNRPNDFSHKGNQNQPAGESRPEPQAELSKIAEIPSEAAQTDNTKPTDNQHHHNQSRGRNNYKRNQRGGRNHNHHRDQKPFEPKEAPEAALPTDEIDSITSIEATSVKENDAPKTPEITIPAAESAPTKNEASAALNEYIETTEAPIGSFPNAEIIEELNSTDEASPEADETVAQETELETYEIVGVRFKSTSKIYYFDPDGLKLHHSDSVIVDTARGLEYGVVDIGNRIVTERDVVLPLRKVIRVATEEDIAHAESNIARAAEAFTICAEKIADHNLEMKLVDVEYTFDNSKLLFYFTADGRVDFRDLVKDLAGVFRTRIELRQIGIRDETKLLGGIGICGRPFCCKSFLSDFVQVSIKMAKEQNLSLNSVKISGACGRLMCCLRYEYDTYAEEIRKTPKLDQIVSTPDGEGVVIEVQPLAGLVRVRFTDKQDVPAKVFHRDLVTVIGGKGAKK